MSARLAVVERTDELVVPLVVSTRGTRREGGNSPFLLGELHTSMNTHREYESRRPIDKSSTDLVVPFLLSSHKKNQEDIT